MTTTSQSSCLARPVLLIALGLSLFWVLACWGFWENGVQAFGINFTFFLLAAFTLFALAAKRGDVWRMPAFAWNIPLLLIALSFSIYENPFVLWVNLLVWPVAFALSCVSLTTSSAQAPFWNLQWLGFLADRILQMANNLGTGTFCLLQAVYPFPGKRSNVAGRVLIGLSIFAVLALTIIIPLLSAADPAFAELMKHIVDFITRFINIETLLRFLPKGIFLLVLAVGMTAGLIAWSRTVSYEDRREEKRIDDIIAGVTLGGVLLLYLLFLWTQVQSIFVPSLPEAFSDTEMLVKKGFWQLFILSVINVFFFLFSYRHTGKKVQHILSAFTVASLLLLLSAAQRMGMYVYYYGLSYEKFFASYTVLFACILFAKLITSLFSRNKADIIKFLFFGFLWLYAVATILPTEQFIFRMNRRLASMEGSRIDMRELQMLSSDVYGLAREERSRHPGDAAVWDEWLTAQREISDAKRWYEMNVQDVKLRVGDVW